MKVITRKTKVYKFNELTADAQDKALETMWGWNVDDRDWWDFVYEDAKQIGLTIKGFDLDRGSYCKGDLMWDAESVAKAIIENHGGMCETYKTATAYLKELKALQDASDDPDEADVDTGDIDYEFKQSLLEDYRIMLQHEYEYLTSRESIIETIEANDYDFTADGEIFS